MNIVGHVRVDMKPVKQIMRRLGIDAQGDVQRFHTANVRRRIQKYMPYRTGTTIKLMIVQSPVEEPRLNINVPYARKLYCGKAARGQPIQYTTRENPQAGPFWDRRLVAAEGAQMSAELQDYVRRRGR